MNPYLPDGIRVYNATECKMKPGEIAFAKFSARLYSDVLTDTQLKAELCELMLLDEYLVPKKTKSGIKDIAMYFRNSQISWPIEKWPMFRPKK